MDQARQDLACLHLPSGLRRVQDLLRGLADGGDAPTDEHDLCALEPNFIADERGRVVEIHMDGLTAIVRALDPSRHGSLLELEGRLAMPDRARPVQCLDSGVCFRANCKSKCRCRRSEITSRLPRRSWQRGSANIIEFTSVAGLVVWCAQTGLLDDEPVARRVGSD